MPPVVDLERERAAEERAAWYTETAIPPLYRRATFVDSRETPATTAARAWLDAQPASRGALGLLGPTGVGKTHGMACLGRALYDAGRAGEAAEVAAYHQRMLTAVRTPIVRTWASRVYRRVRWLHAPSLVRQALNFREQADAWDLVETASLLFVDDVGQGADRFGDGYWSVVDELVTQREAARTPLVFTSNLTAAALVEVLGDRAADRLQAWATLAPCRGKSLRA
jgi:DNA replication protein DnaC